MAIATLAKGSTVEVCSNEVGFEGSWYVATLMDVIETSATKKKASNRRSRSRNKTGYVVKFATLFEDDDATKQLMEVVDPSFVRPVPPRNPRRNNDNEAEAEAEEEEEEAGDFELHDVVDAFYRDGWWIGVVKKVTIEGEIKKYIVSFDSPPEEVEFERSQIRLHVDWIDCRWKVPLKKVLQTPSTITLRTDASGKRKRHSQPWQKAGTMGTNGETAGHVETSSGKRLQSSAGLENIGGTGYSEVVVPATEAGGSPIIMETPETEAGKSQPKRKRGRPQKLPIRRPNGLLEDNQEAGNTVHEICTDELPISVMYQGLHPLSVLKQPSCLDHAIKIKNAETKQQLPFVKQSPIWGAIESLKVYQNPPQNPHFSPLKDIKEDYREGLAISHMVTFANVVERILKLQWGDGNDVFESSLETLDVLETFGFDVGGVRDRVCELQSTKAGVSQLEGELKEAEKEIEKHNREKSMIDEEICQVELMIKDLQVELAQKLVMKNAKNAEIMKLQTNLQDFSKRMKHQMIAFNLLAASPL